MNPIRILRHNLFRTNLIFFYLLLGLPDGVFFRIPLLKLFIYLFIYLFTVSHGMLIFILLKTFIEERKQLIS
jgi:hypothetical protein